MAIMPLRARKPMLLMIYVAIFGVLTTAIKEEVSTTAMGPVFVFGDSTMDVGTNNYLKNCTARADNPYYGIDYPGSVSTGRFSNGLNLADTMVKLLGGYDLSPLPFLSLVNISTNFTGDILHGVNFASGGAGLSKQTGLQLFGQVISMEEQIQQFSVVRGNITALLGESKADLLLQSSMYIISAGSNDIMEYVYAPTMSPELFIINLTDTYASHLTNLYDMGARKFGILGIGPIGCCPKARSISSSGACSNATNSLASATYASFGTLLQNLSSTLEGFKYSLGNAYNMTMDIINNPSIVFKDVETACCGNKTEHGLGDCTRGAHLCTNRDDNLFWDAFHPSQRATTLAANILVFGQNPEYVSPINFSCLRKA